MGQIQANSIVTMHFDLRLKDGSVAESSREIGQPMTFVMGEGTFSEKFESAMLGLSQGDKKKIMLLPEDAFGEAHPANIFQVPLNKFKGTDLEGQLEVGLIVSFAQPNGQEMPGVVRELTQQEATVDFNHPLAGQVVLFDVEVVEVKEP